MARRPESESVMTKEQLADFERRLSMLSDQGVEGVYQDAYSDCRYEGKQLPQPIAVQQLIAAWRELRRFRRASRG
jgi:hypothetical protein